MKHGWYYGHKNKRSHISPPLSEMTILSEVMKDAWEQSSVIFTSSSDPEEQKRLNGNIKANKTHLLVIITLTVKIVFLGKKSQNNLLKGKAVVPLVWLLSDTPNGGTLWFRYSKEFTANTTTPPEDITQHHHVKSFASWILGCFEVVFV